MSASNPVFIVGCACSGTTLLRLMLDAHPDLCVPSESHFIYQCLRRVARGSLRDLTGVADWARLKDMIAASPWLEHWALDRAELRRRLDAVPRGEPGRLFAACFELEAERAGKPRWGDKTPQHVQYMPVLARLFPDARFVHVIRDGRGAAHSLLNRPWGPGNAFTAGPYWVWMVLSGLLGGRLLGERYTEVRYEALVTEPEGELRRLCEWLGLHWDPAVLEHHRTESARRFMSHGHPDKLAGRPLDADRARRWRDELRPWRRGLIEQQAGELLHHLGYPLHAPARYRARVARLRRALDAAAWPGRGPPPSPARLGAIRLGQGVNLALRRYGGWARGSIAWQAGLCARFPRQN